LFFVFVLFSLTFFLFFFFEKKSKLKQAGFFGKKSEFVMSGSDEGAVIFWDSNTGEMVQAIRGDGVITNCVQEHPYLPLLATSGIDSDIKLFLPSAARLRTKEGFDYFRRNLRDL